MESKNFDLKNINLIRSNNVVQIEITCPHKFDENDLACFWCISSDKCRRDCENEDLQSKTE